MRFICVNFPLSVGYSVGNEQKAMEYRFDDKERDI